MKLTILSAVFFLFLASCQGLSIRQRSQPDSKHYVITAPKIFLGEENVCLTIFDRKSLPEEAKLKVQLRSLEGTTIFETEEELTSGKFLQPLARSSICSFVFLNHRLSMCPSSCR